MAEEARSAGVLVMREVFKKLTGKGGCAVTVWEDVRRQYLHSDDSQVRNSEETGNENKS